MKQEYSIAGGHTYAVTFQSSAKEFARADNATGNITIDWDEVRNSAAKWFAGERDTGSAFAAILWVARNGDAKP